MIWQTSLHRRWHPITPTIAGPVASLSSMMSQVEGKFPHRLPDLRRGKAMFVLSDFGGEHRTSAYEAFSFLLVDPLSFREWDQLWQGYRSRYLHDRRRLSFKDLNDIHRREALPAFFRAAERLNGLLFTMLFSRTIGSFFQSEEGHDRMGDFTRWKPAIFEKLMRSIHLVSFLVAGLSSTNQDVHWYTDDDAIAPNIASLYDVCEVYKRVSGHYFDHPMGHFRFGTARSDDGSRRLEDLLALPDFAAGALAEVMSAHLKDSGPKLGEIARQPPPGIKSKTQLIMNWLSGQTGRLGKVVFLTELAKDTSNLQFRRVDLWGSREIFSRYPRHR